MRTQSALRLRAHRDRLIYVGGTSLGFVGASSGTQNISLTSLTGGAASAPRIGDIVIVAYATGDTGTRAINISTSGYTTTNKLYQNDANDSNFIVGWKVLSTAETSVDVTATLSGTAGGAVAVQVWRGVDPHMPILLPEVTAGNINTRLVNAASVTPTRAGSQVIVCGGGAHVQNPLTYTASDLSNFVQATGIDSKNATAAIGNIAWSSGSVDPAAWTSSATDSVDDSWNAVTLVLQPRSPNYGKIIPLGSTRAVVSGTSLVIDKPSRVVDNDLMIMIVHGTFSGGNDYTITGWTQLYDRAQNGGFAVFHKTASGEGSTFTISATNSTTHLATCIAYRNAAIDVFGTVNITSATAMTATEVTAASNYSILLSIHTASANLPQPIPTTSATSYFNRYVADNSGSSPYNITFEERINSGLTGSRTITTTANNNNTIVLLAIKPS